MITDDERREVARRLRELDDSELQVYDMTYYAMQQAVSDKAPYLEGRELCDRLADLIEPSGGNAELCARCDYCDYCDLPKYSEQDGYSFKPKGYVDLLVLADKTIRSARHDMEICGDTVPAWYSAGRLEAVARSIREILGVES